MSPVHGLRVEALAPDECLGLLSTVAIGRVGATVDALPVVLPVTFALHDGAIVFRTIPDTKLHDATLDTVVAFQADEYRDPHDPHNPSGWSVLVQGMTSRITDPARLEAARLLPLGPWAPGGSCIALDPTVITGRRVCL